eukprot:g6419.t1
MFRCETFASPHGSMQRLVADYELECYQGTWHSMAALAGLVMVVFSFGCPILFYYLMHRRRHELHFTKEEQKQLDAMEAAKEEAEGAAAAVVVVDPIRDGDEGKAKDDQSQQADAARDNATTDGPSEERIEAVESTRKRLGILYETYRDEMYYFESVHMIFKVILWFGLVLLEKGSQFQLALCLCITFIQVAIHAHVLPFNSWDKNLLQMVGFSVTAGVAFAGIVLNYLKEALKVAEFEGRLQRKARLEENMSRFKLAISIITIGGVITIVVVQTIHSTLKAWRNRKKISKKMKVARDRLRSRASSMATKSLNAFSIDDGFWRMDELSKEVYPCPAPLACARDNRTNTSCAYGNQGPLCMVCLKGWVKDGDSAPCQKCEDSAVGVA